ncbi:trypsin 3A1-like isoform X1 [Dermacentor andersoni]|uniref:trypsin 3A1-like isoform X1 n=1 Tax=Dermacentor andersoni TaxID=34620 RepID=UPI002415EED1|nr:serine proteinase stubble-like isoform X1 [Dermacentor andersoni]
MPQICFAIVIAHLCLQISCECINTPRCGRAVPLSRIVNGQTVSRTKMPWIVSYVYQIGSDIEIANLIPAVAFVRVFLRVSFRRASQVHNVLTCSGSIVSPSFVVSAAHCLTEPNDKTAASGVVVYYNSTERKKGPEIQAKRFARHPKFVLSVYANDIAVLQLEKPLNFDKFVSPICLPKKPLNITGRPLLIAGWGLTKEDGQDSDTLRYILKKEMPYKQCKPFLHTEAQLKLNETIVICTTAGSKDACTGDSGGPVTTWNKRGKFFQVGIVSFGYGCARPNEASGYTRVATFVPWILSVMKRYERDGHRK